MSEPVSNTPVKAARAAPEAIVQLIVFQLGDEEYGIRIGQVKEVTVTPEITKMPKTPGFIKGIANLRGDIIAILDLEERFQLRRSGRELPTSSFTIAVEAPGYTIGLLVREVPRPLSLPLSLLEPAPDFLQDSGQRDKYLEGIAKLPEGGVIIVLDLLKLLTPTEILRLPGKGAPSAAAARTTA
ncbi:chemotaxis protein CheW [uncultured Hymenobacter sp.]|uniref:chemotaxis protein CheW n=1 Tax=uncultured Hymenobacter sp. TaxID=170016 RepID=UPI0035CAE1F8